MVERNRDLGIFCNISAHSLLDAEFFPRFIEFMRGNADLSNAVFFEFSQETVNAFGPLEHESLSALRELGFSFSLDRVTRLDFDAEALALRGFRFIKVDCDTLLNRSREAGAQIHGADLSELLRRSGIEMIVEKIETERSVIDLLDYDVAFGQGYLFSAPRPVRGEVLERAPLRATGTA
jgi:cyclic-di-GMP phosphodiesterase TipF (flagellum assembly factor)